MKEATKLPELPRLPKGQGTLIYTHGNKILYRKAIPVDGGYKRLAVTGNNIRECFDTMRRKEDDLRAGMKSAGSESLAMAIDRWLDLYKQPEVKPSSYDRLRITYKAQITKMTIADKPWKLITADELQVAVNALVQDGYAWSTVKKAYDMLNAFYTFQTRRGYLPRSPMDICRMPLRENMLKRDKEIVYMTEPQIKVFCEEALSFAEGSTQLKYRYGPAFVFLIYTGLRIGELCALQWKDFDMEKATVSITKNLIEVYNRDYELTYERTNRNLSVHGYQEEGTITTSFDMRVQNEIDRFHLVKDALLHLPQLGNRGAYIIQQMNDKLVAHKNYIHEIGQDMPEILDWKWHLPENK